MKKAPIITAFTLLLAVTACKKSTTTSSSFNSLSASTGTLSASSTKHEHSGGDWEQVNLVADVGGFGHARVDPNLSNAWGIAYSPNGAIWVASNHTGLADIYNANGTQAAPPVSIPLNNSPNGASPDGIVYNYTSGFVIPSNHQKSKFIFATEDGIISAWSSGNSAITVADRSLSGAVYKGLALASNGAGNYIYATNFSAGTIDVFDQSFHYVHMGFADPTMPVGYAPFNIQLMDGKLFVTYAKQKPDHHDDMAGPGNGYINIFKTDGTLVRRFASQGTLNSPWGLTQIAISGNENILVGNFGDGRINIYDTNGSFLGQLMDEPGPVTIDGLWAISFAPESVPGQDGKRIYFTAGPNEESDGLFGYLKKK